MTVGPSASSHWLPPSQPLEKFYCNSLRPTHRGQLSFVQQNMAILKNTRTFESKVGPESIIHTGTCQNTSGEKVIFEALAL